MNRRHFLGNTTGATAGMLATGLVAKAQPNERVQVGVMGTGGRALQLIRSFARNANVEIVALADIDPRKFGPALAAVQPHQKTTTTHRG